MLLFGIFVVCTFISTGSAHATWYVTHGHSGHVETEANLDSPVVYLGWGLDIQQTFGTTNWVHFAVPTDGTRGRGARYVKIKFKAFSQSMVTAVHIYNGGIKVAEFTGSWTGENTLTLDLGKVKSFTNGLGISVQIQASPVQQQPDYGRIIFYGAGANFVAISTR
jgi:hypothetical protein